MMLSPDWSHRAVTVVMQSHTGPGWFAFYGANHPDTIEDVHARRVDPRPSTLDPAGWRILHAWNARQEENQRLQPPGCP